MELSACTTQLSVISEPVSDSWDQIHWQLILDDVEAESNMKSWWSSNMIYGEETCNKCFIIPTHDICAQWTIRVFNGFMSRWHVSYVTLDMQIIHLFTIQLVCSIALLRWHVQHTIFKDKLQLKAS